MSGIDADIELDARLARGRAWLCSALGLPNDASPFAWQVELLRRFLTGEVVEALDIPTGLGKTSVVAIWLVAMACGAKVPRRLVYVVDRRAVVDQATEVAEALRAWVGGTPEVARALNLGTRPLPISTLRGQHVDNRAWLEDPSMPAIVVGTVDMVGSRLLFAGYGVSTRMRPYHAGLLGADTLLVLDEAHLSQPFERLIEQVARGFDANEHSLRSARTIDLAVPLFRSLSLSATGRSRPQHRVLGLSDQDRDPAGVVWKRLTGRKQLSLREDAGDKELPEVLAREAWELTERGTKAARVIVFCARREHAQKVDDALRKLARGSDVPAPCLLVGGRRVYERQVAAERLRELGFVAGQGGPRTRASFVVATSAGEVGVDLDADHAACDLVAWERMVQRLGRVNRRGDGDARVVVVPVKATQESEQQIREATRKLLAELPHRGAIDVSLAALTALKERAATDPVLHELMERATTPAPLHPPLLRAQVEAWSMTSLLEHTGRPEVAPWIRGWPEEEEEPQTTLVWRRHLPITSHGSLFEAAELSDFLESAGPHLAEKLETESWRVVAWLEKRAKVLGKNTDKVATDDLASRGSKELLGILLGGPEGRAAIVRAEDVATGERRKRLERSLAGATLMLDARVGGLAEGLLADDTDGSCLDVTEVENAGGDRIVPFHVRSVSDASVTPATSDWRTEALFLVRPSEDGDSEWLAVESVVQDAAESEEGRSTGRRAQLLTEHEEWTELEARRIAGRLGLPERWTEVLATAARLHDEGKRARRWQRAFHVPNDGSPPFAKSATHRPNLALLEGYRHELGSLPYAEAHPRVKQLAPEERDLCLHLIAAHHGGARPVIRTKGADEPPSKLAARASEIALRFAALEKAWGPWGLAWWESLLRAADQSASRRNDEAGDHG